MSLNRKFQDNFISYCPFMTADEQNILLKEALQLIAQKCPPLIRQCYWAGTSPVALEDLHHRQSFDLDFHTRRALVDVRPLLAEMSSAFPRKFEVIQAPDSLGAGFRGALEVANGEKITVEVLSNYEDVNDTDLVESR